MIHDMPVPRRSPDPKDDATLAAAVASKAEFVVSGDNPGLLVLGEVERIPIRTPRKALQMALGP